MNFEGKIILVTGAASGIGATTCKRFLAQCGSVIGLDLNRAGLSEMATEYGSQFTPIGCDMRNELDIKSAAGVIEESHGRIDVLVNNAGVAKYAGTDFLTEDFDLHFHVNLRGPMLMVKHFVELLRASDAPAMVNIGSVAGRVEWPDHFLYSCTKAGIEKYTQHLVRDLPWIRSNCVIPGFIDTSILDGLCAQEEKAGLFKVVEETLPCGRMGHPDDIAKAILFLTSADADYINGASLVVDGGFLHSSKWLGV